MAEGTRFAKLDDAIKSLNKFRSNTEDQIREINNSISTLVELVNQRWEDKHDTVSRSTDMATTVNPHSNINMPFRSMKIDVPHFDGSDLTSWLFKLEQFFQFYNTPEDQRITISSYYLEGSALSWFTWMRSNGFIESWKGFVKAIKFRFGPSLFEDPKDALSKVQLAIEQDVAPVEELSPEKLTTISSNNVIPEVSIHAISGHISPRPTRVKIQDEQDTTILEDLSTKIQDEQDTKAAVVEEEDTTTTTTAVQDSVVVGCSGLLEGQKFGMDPVILPIQGVDVVLGIQWLEFLDSMVANYKQLPRDFQGNAKSVHLMGEPQPLLQQYSFIFEEPFTLPPFMETDHQIHSKSDAALVKVKPYKYHHFQKSEMKDTELVNGEDLLVQEMLNHVWLQLKQNLLIDQKTMKSQADENRMDLSFQEGDLVTVKLYPHKQQFLTKRLTYKLFQRFYGPFRIVARIRKVAFKLSLPDTSKIRPVFHVFVFSLAIVNNRVINDGDKRKNQVLVQWSGLPIEETSWEDLDNLKDEFLHLNLEDQVHFDGEWNDTNITSATAAVVEEGIEITEKGAEEKKEIARSFRVRRKPTGVEDYIL